MQPSLFKRRRAAGAEEGEAFCLGERGEFRLQPAVADMLYIYQLDGLRWLYSLHTLQRGGILGEEGFAAGVCRVSSVGHPA